VPVVGYILDALVAYLLGSIPTGFLVAKSRGLDIRRVGSGNIGATNVFRTLGRPAGLFVLLADALKGWLAVTVAATLLCDWFFPDAGSLSREWFHILAALCAVLGHNYTCWLYFKGGKGIATSAGVLAALVPVALLIILGIWLILVALTRYVSLASICASATLPLATWLTPAILGQGPGERARAATLTIITGGLAVLAIYKHKANIKRLLNGTENRIGTGKPPSPSPPDTPA
jgi:glycerol-3-phosphate acyltransferase PlsY